MTGSESTLELGDKVETRDGARGTVEQIHPELDDVYLVVFQPRLAWYSGKELFGPLDKANLRG